MFIPRGFKRYLVIFAFLVYILLYFFFYSKDLSSSASDFILIRSKEKGDENPKCSSHRLVLSSDLPSRKSFGEEDGECRDYSIQYLIPGCRKPEALASFPGSGNTWLRYLLDTSIGIFTGSRYKDIEIQGSGLWGEIREWNDGTTILQKTHDASFDHVLRDFSGKGILLLRNPYDAILAVHNFMYAGHVGHAGQPGSEIHFSLPTWSRFVAIQMSKWLDMATNWTVLSSPDKIKVVHLENLKTDLESELKTILRFLRIPVDSTRLKCVSRYRNGFFHRSSKENPVMVPFQTEIRVQIDRIIDYVNDILIHRGYDRMPLDKYDYYRKTDKQILTKIREYNQIRLSRTDKDGNSHSITENDKNKGTQMILKSYLKFWDKNSGSNLYASLSNSSYAEGASFLFRKAIEWWPSIKTKINKDPIQEVIETDTYKDMRLEDIPLPRYSLP